MENEYMENEQVDQPLVSEEAGYKPRPAWQVWAARIGVVIMIICVALYYWHIASGGMR